MLLHIVNSMVADMVADKEIDKVADMVAGQWSQVLINWAQTFSTQTFIPACASFYKALRVYFYWCTSCPMIEANG